MTRATPNHASHRPTYSKRVARRSASALVLMGLLLPACKKEALPADKGSSGPASAQDVRATDTAAQMPESMFTDVARDVGLDFHHFIGATGKYYFVEIMGSGCALFDFDDDGDLDVYLVQGNMVDRDEPLEASLFPLHEPAPPSNRLYRNEIISSGPLAGSLHFVDVTAASGTGDLGYGMGVATGDYDNDGDVDLFVTNFGPDVLYRNNGDGTFTDVTDAAGVGDPRWTVSASFFDYDNDGFLDLAVVGYTEYALSIDKKCFTVTGVRDYCSPLSYLAIPDRLYHNRGDGTFEDVSPKVGLDKAYGNGLGVLAADFDQNGWTDLLVANDGVANQLWMNEKAQFADEAVLNGVAYNHAGHAEAGMGVAAEDFDDDGDCDIFLTHLFRESNTLYLNVGFATFEDATGSHGLGQPSLAYTSFGTAFVDVDHDADLDILTVSGTVRFPETATDERYPLQQPNQLFLQSDNHRFVERTQQGGPDITVPLVSRGLATGDVDNDGDVDVLVLNNNGPAQLLRNNLPPDKPSLILRVIDGTTHRDAYGAAVRAKLSTGRVLTRRVHTDGSYASASDPRVHLAWPSDVRIESLEIVHPRGDVEPVEVPAGQRVATITIHTNTTESTR